MNEIHRRADRLDLNLLKVFEAVYRERHLTRAAASLFLTPSAVSHAIRRLRAHLEDPLFVRDGKVMRPTPICERMAPALLEEIGKLRQLLQHWGRFNPAETRQTFKIAIPEALEIVLLPELARKLRDRAPFARVESVRSDRRGLPGALAGASLDLAIDVALSIGEPVRRRLFLQDEFCVVARSKHPLPALATTEDYLAGQHIAVSTRPAGNVLEDAALLNLGLTRGAAVRCQNYHSAARLAEQCDYLLTMPALLARELAKDKKLLIQALPFETPPIRLYMYWHSNSDYDAANLWLRAVCMELSAFADGSSSP